MPLYWLCYRHDNLISVVIEPGASLIHARMRASLANLDEGEFTEAYELQHKWRDGPIHMAACSAASRDYVFGGPEL